MKARLKEGGKEGTDEKELVAYDPGHHQDTTSRRKRSPFAHVDLFAYLYFFIMNF